MSEPRGIPMMTATETSFYITDGTLRHDAPSYVERKADADLYDGLSRGEFCYVLTSRQMGKSSLMNRTAARLRREGVAVVILDLTRIGQNLTPEQWYDGLLTHVGRYLDLEDELEQFWLDHENLGPLQRWMAAIEQVVLPGMSARCSVLGARRDKGPSPAGERAGASAEHRAPSTEHSRLVIFIDEIDAVRSLPFSADEFFAGIRECYIRRSEDAEFNRLTFCLLGTAAPSDLIQDTRTTPFNIGRRIELTDFTETEAAPLSDGLIHHGDTETRRTAKGEQGNDSAAAQALLKRILHWTGGHPYLTQRLCRAVAEQALTPTPDTRHPTPLLVDRHCEALFLSAAAREQDNNLLFVRERLLKSEADRASLLDLYARIRAGKRVPNDETNQLVTILRLSGIGRVVAGAVRVRNRIYERAFDREWVAEHMPDAELRRQRSAYRRGLVRAAAVAGVIVAVMAGLAGTAVRQRGIAVAERVQNAQRLVRMNTANGMRLVEEGDLFGALVWLAEAWRLDQGQPSREAMHRMRFASVLRQCPKLVQAWAHEGDVNDAEFSPDGDCVVTAGSDGTATVRDVATGKALGAPLKHEKGVICASFSPDGRRVLTASDDGTARVWDAATGKAITPPLKHEKPVTDAEFSADGRRVVTASEDQTAQVWDAATGKPVVSPFKHGSPVNRAAFSPDGRRVVTACGTWGAGAARVWDAVTGKQITVPMSQGEGLTDAAFSPDGRRIVTVGHHGLVGVWDAATGRPITTPRIASSPSRAAFSPDSRRVVTAGGPDATARVWDAATGEPIGLPLQHRGDVQYAAFSPDGRRVVTARADHTARIWDAATGAPVTPPLKHAAAVNHAAFSPDGRRVVTASADQTARVWDAATSETPTPPLEHRPFAIECAAFSPDGRRVVTATWDNTARVWDTATGRPVTSSLSHNDSVDQAAFSADGRRVVTASADHTARVWDATTGAPISPPLLHGSAVSHAELSPDGLRVVTASWDKMTWVWDAVTGRPVTPPLKHKGSVRDAAFSPDGRRVVTASDDGTAQVWDAKTGKPLLPPFKHASGVSHAVFSPDGRWIVTASGGKAQVWDAKTGKSVARPLHAGGTWGTYAPFSPDGRRLVLTSEDEMTARVWDVATSRAVTPSLKHSGRVMHAAFSRDGRRVVTASGDGTARVWDAATGEPLTPPLKHSAEVYHAEFSPDGRRVVTASIPAQVWRLPDDDRPLPDALTLARLLAAEQIDDTGGSVPIERKTALRDWETLRGRYPRDFIVSLEQVLAWHWREAQAYEKAGDWGGAISHLAPLIEAKPATWQYWERRARAYGKSNTWARSAADYRKAVALGADHFLQGSMLALAQLISGDNAGYRRTCADLLDRFSKDTGAAQTVAETCVLAPNAAADPARPIRLAEKAVAAQPGDSRSLGILGGALCRAGRYDEAVRSLNDAFAAGAGPQPALLLAITHSRIGHTGEAGQWLAEGERLDRTRREERGRDAGNSLTGWFNWCGRLQVRLLHREAESLLHAAHR